MNSLILQPAGNKVAYKHYLDTILKPVPQEKFSRFIEPSIMTRIKEYYGNNPVPIWGVTPGKTNSNVVKWEKVQPGDITIFSKNKSIFSSGVVTLKFRSSKLAQSLWGKTEDGETWEYIYLLDDIRNLHINYVDFNKLVGYKENYIIQGFNVLAEEKSSAFIDYFDLYSNRYFPSMDIEKYKDTLKELEKYDSLDKFYNSKNRLEQSYLRDTLFSSRKTHECAICHSSFPINFLVAAHIKKRTYCTKEEKLDINNIVLPMCKFGCDDLYEHGYISVKNGRVVKKQNVLNTQNLENYIDKLIGNKIDQWNEYSKKYFEWHLEYHNIV